MWRSRVFFCKPKTAYEWRISDWSSYGCSSDLMRLRIGRRLALAGDVRPVVVGIVPVQLQPGFGLGIGVGHDGLGRAFRLADAAVDALVGMDHQHVLAL